MAYLLFVMVACAVGISLVVWRNRPKTSTEDGIRAFGRNLDALAPPDGSTRGSRPSPKG